MRLFLFICAIGDRPVVTEVTLETALEDRVSCQVMPVLKGLEVFEKWAQFIDERWYVIIRIE